jgi:hypothetical protein
MPFPALLAASPAHSPSRFTRLACRHCQSQVGATHLPLPALFRAFLDAGLTIERFTEGGEPTPTVLAVRARKSR